MPSVRDQLHETHRQALEIQRDRHVLIDHSALEARSSREPWDALFHPPTDLPLYLFLLVLHHGVSPVDRGAIDRLAAALASAGPLSPYRITAAMRRLSSLATTVDNFPPALLHGAEGGLHAACVQLAHRRRLNPESVINVITQLGSYKGAPKPVHLFESHRPLSITSPLAAFEAAAGGQLIRTTAELTGNATPELFAYRTEVQPAYMVFAIRAAAVRTLLQWSLVAICKWDESHAYFRIPRAAATQTLRLTPGTWNFGDWFTDYYTSLQIRVLTDVGFTAPIVTQEGANQGCAAADQCFQGTQACLNTTMRHYADVGLPSMRGPLPCTRASFSDDRIFLAPSMRRLLQAIMDCVHCSRAVGRTPNPHKLEFTLVSLQAGAPMLKHTDVPGMDTRTQPHAPTLVGIPLLPGLPVRKTMAKLIPKFRRQLTNMRAEAHMNPLLRVRSFMAYALSAHDFVARGFLFTPLSLATLQTLTRRHWRRSYRLPKWTPHWYLHRPLHAGGPGCRDLHIRNAIQLMTTLLQASVGRHPLAQAGANYLLHSGQHLTEGPLLRSLLGPGGIEVHAVPGPTLAPCLQHTQGSLGGLCELDVVYLAYDAAVSGNSVAGGAVFWHPTTGELMTIQFACQIFRPSGTDGEWLARLVPLQALSRWSGTVVYVTDGANSCTRRFTRGPRSSSLLVRGFKHVQTMCAHLRHRDFWVHAQHSSLATDILANLNRRAHTLAHEYRGQAQPYRLPILDAYAGCAVATVDGSVLLDPARHMEVVHSRILTTALPSLANWDTGPWTSLYLADDLKEVDVCRALQHRLYALAPAPPGVGCYVCPYCTVSVHNLQYHLLHRCPPAFVALLRAAAAFWTSATLLVHLGRYASHLQVIGGTLLCDHEGEAVFGVQADLSVPVLPSATYSAHILSLTGLWYSTSTTRTLQRVANVNRQEVLRRVLQAAHTTRPRQTLEDLMASHPWSIAGRQVRWTMPPYRSLPAAVVLFSDQCLTFECSATLTLVLRSSPWTRLFLAATPVLPLPAPEASGAPLYVICTLGPTPGTAPHLAAMTSDAHPHVYIIDSNEDPEWLFAQHSPLRVVWRCAGQQIVITHGVPWDQTLFHTAE